MAWFEANQVKAKDLIKDAQPDKAQRAVLALSMYTDLPDGEVAIEEFERFAMDRLRGEGRACLAWPVN